ncbi:MAG: GAF domain-containing protein [Candidatus Methylomirabilales bacterium]
MDELEQELRLFLKEVGAKTGAGQRGAALGALASAVSRALDLRQDELAILIPNRDRTLLEFVYPPELAEGGINKFPLSVPSLASRVVQTGRSVLINAARDVPHLDFYERIRIKGETPRQIQKLLAVGLKNSDGKVQAVIEASRRGDTHGEAGPDFRPEDQRRLEELAAAAAPALAVTFEWKA